MSTPNWNAVLKNVLASRISNYRFFIIWRCLSPAKALNFSRLARFCKYVRSVMIWKLLIVTYYRSFIMDSALLQPVGSAVPAQFKYSYVRSLIHYWHYYQLFVIRIDDCRIWARFENVSLVAYKLQPHRAVIRENIIVSQLFNKRNLNVRRHVNHSSPLDHVLSPMIPGRIPMYPVSPSSSQTSLLICS
jgi:hypothetical protein